MSPSYLASHGTQLAQKLVDTLRALPDVEAHISGDDDPLRAERHSGYDVKIDTQVGGRPLTLLVEAKKTVYPRDVLQTLWRLKAQSGIDSSSSTVSVLAANSLSPGAKDLLRAEGIGYFDSGGSLYLPAAGAYVFIDRPPPKAHTSAMRSLFTGRRAQAIHALLALREQWFGVKQLAAISQVSPATASEVLTELEKFEWIDTRGQGPGKERHLREPRAMLDSWASQVVAGRAQTLRRYFVPGLKGDTLVDRVAQAFEHHEVPYAITHEAAAQRYAPYLSNIGQVRGRVLMTPKADDALADLGARVVHEGANLAVIDVKSPGELLFKERVGNAWLASPIHVYIDLLTGEGRAKEMAQHLRAERIRT